MQFKTKPFAHQLEAFELSKNAEAFAYLMEQGTGKSKVAVDVAAHLHGKGKINAVLIVAPNGVHLNWVLNEITAHLHDSVEYRAAVWRSAQTKKLKERIEWLYERGNFMRILAVNVEAFVTAKGRDAVWRFLQTFECMWVMDESSRIKHHKAQRTKHIVDMSTRAPVRRILTGTPVTQAPLDLFPQFQFLDPWILRTQSFFAFKAQYAELLPENHGLMRHIQQRAVAAAAARGKKPRIAALQVIARDAQGRPKYRNIDKLAALIAPYSYRVLKADCLDLPDKLYQRVYCEMSPRQSAMYEDLRRDLRVQLSDGALSTVTKLTLIGRLQQVLGGFGPNLDGTRYDVPLFDKPSDNPRVRAVIDAVEESIGGVIIWARYIHEIAAIVAALHEEFPDDKVVAYHGAIGDADRQAAIEQFQRGDARFFVGQQRTGGIGITLTAARTMVYYSNEFSLEVRLQSEDRAHRIGQRHPVTYIDIEAEGTIDKKVITALRSKKDVADLVTGDPQVPWI